MNAKLFTAVMAEMPHGTFTQKHFIAAADTMRRERATLRQIKQLAAVFEATNPRFKPHLFARRAAFGPNN